MKLVVRKDGISLNLSAAITFTPNKKGLVVEMPGNQFYIVLNLFRWHLTDEDKIHYNEFKGWPE